MRKRKEATLNKDSRISIFTCSSGTAWKLVVGKHPFGKAGGTRGSVRTGRDSGREPRIPWVDGEIVGGSKRGDRELVEEALAIAKRIMVLDDGPAFAYGLKVSQTLTSVLHMRTETKEQENEFASEVERIVSALGREHASDHRHEMSLYPSMPPSDYRVRERARRRDRARETVEALEAKFAAQAEAVVEKPAMVEIEEVMIVPVRSYGTPSPVEHDCI